MKRISIYFVLCVLTLALSCNDTSKKAELIKKYEGHFNTLSNVLNESSRLTFEKLIIQTRDFNKESRVLSFNVQNASPSTVKGFQINIWIYNQFNDLLENIESAEYSDELISGQFAVLHITVKNPEICNYDFNELKVSIYLKKIVFDGNVIFENGIQHSPSGKFLEPLKLEQWPIDVVESDIKRIEMEIPKAKENANKYCDCWKL